MESQVVDIEKLIQEDRERRLRAFNDELQALLQKHKVDLVAHTEIFGNQISSSVKAVAK